MEQTGLDDLMHAIVSLAVNGEEMINHSQDDQTFTSDAGCGHWFDFGDRLIATIGGKPVLDMKVKL